MSYFDEPKAESWSEERIINRLHRCRRYLLLFGMIDDKADVEAFNRTVEMQARQDDIHEEET